MRAWVLERPGPIEESPLRLIDLPDPEPGPGEISVAVEQCGLCRTDIHIIEGEIDLPVLPIVPGHQAIGRVLKGGARFAEGDRVGVAWLHKTCAACAACARGDENLCRSAHFTGYHEHGGFAERLTVPEDFAYALEDHHTAPLLCAGIIGYRALRQADVTHDETVGLYGFGSSAHIALQIARSRGNRVFVVTRGEQHRELARKMGAAWVGDACDTPPEPMDRVVIFAPAGDLIPDALEAVRWGGTVASAAIHMSPIPEMDYTKHLFGERTLRSTTASTRQDGIELLRERVETEQTFFDFERVHEGLLAIKNDAVSGSAVLRVA